MTQKDLPFEDVEAAVPDLSLEQARELETLAKAREAQLESPQTPQAPRQSPDGRPLIEYVQAEPNQGSTRPQGLGVPAPTA